MRLASPLFFALILPFLIVMYANYRKKLSDSSFRFPVGQRGLDWKATDFTFRRSLLLLLRICGIGALLVALCSPQTKVSLSNRPEGFVEMLLALDSSPAMKESIHGIDRFAMAKQGLKDFIALRHEDRLGLMRFAQDSAVLVPPSLDHSLVQKALDQYSLNQGDTQAALGSAIANGVKHLRASKARGRVLVYILSGAPNSGKIGLTTATSLASNFGIRVYLIALQPKLELAPGERAPESPLAKLTFRTGGKFFEADRPETLALALKEIAELEVYRGPEGDEAFWQERFQWALLIALAFLVLEFCFAKTFLRVLPA